MVLSMCTGTTAPAGRLSRGCSRERRRLPGRFCRHGSLQDTGTRLCLQRARMASVRVTKVLLSHESGAAGGCGDGRVFGMKGFGGDPVV